MSEPDKKVKSHVIDCITELACSVSRHQGKEWNEIVGWSFKLYDSKEERDKQDALQILGYLCEEAFHQVQKDFDKILNLYATSLKMGSLQVECLFVFVFFCCVFDEVVKSLFVFLSLHNDFFFCPLFFCNNITFFVTLKKKNQTKTKSTHTKKNSSKYQQLKQ